MTKIVYDDLLRRLDGYLKRMDDTRREMLEPAP